MKHFTILFSLAALMLLAATDSVLVAQGNGRDDNPQAFPARPLCPRQAPKASPVTARPHERVYVVKVKWTESGCS
jgi:hypothetical protein